MTGGDPLRAIPQCAPTVPILAPRAAQRRLTAGPGAESIADHDKATRTIDQRAEGRDRGAVMGPGLRVLHLPGLLHPAARPGRDQLGRPGQPADPVDRGVPRDAHRGARVLLGRRALAARDVRPVGEPVLHRMPGRVLRRARLAPPRRPPLDRSRVLRVGQRVRAVRGHRVLGLHGRPVHERAGQAAVRPDCGRRFAGRDHRIDRDRRPGRRVAGILASARRLRPAGDGGPGGSAAAA